MRGLKFTEKYGVESATIYKGAAGSELAALRIPPKNHPLYDPTAPTTFDELRVQQIDADGHMTTPIEVWTDPDKGILWVLDGRGRFLDVEEVNRRRAKEGRELVQPYIVPFRGDEKAAIARVRAKNYHRRTPTPSGMGCDILALRRAGWSWEDTARHLHVKTDDAEQWCRRLLPLAFCIPEVQAAFDAREFPLSFARKFARASVEGEDVLSKQEQLDLLARLRAERAAPKPDAKPRFRSGRVRTRVVEQLRQQESGPAQLAAAMLAWLEGDDDALAAWPELARIVKAAQKEPTQKEPESASAKKASAGKARRNGVDKHATATA
jgi:hypothetical protein